MPSIVNGLFSGRSGINSHGVAIAVIGDNISNASTVGYKRARTEFEDLVAGGQAEGKIVGSGSSIAAVSTLFEQGTLEFTGRNLDMAIDGNGYFIVQDGATDSRFYTRAGNFTVDAEGFMVNQKNQRVLGFASNGSGALEDLNLNTISQSSVQTDEVTIAGNLDANGTPFIAAGAITDPTAIGSLTPTTYGDLNADAAFSTVLNVFDTLGTSHTVTLFFYHTQPNEYRVGAYVNSEEVDASGTETGLPRLIGPDPSAAGATTLTFDGDGTLNLGSSTSSFTANITWNNAADPSAIDFDLSSFSMYSTGANIQSIVQDGVGIGAVTNISIDRDGLIYALLDNGQAAEIGTIGMANFANPEGLVRIGTNLLQSSQASGAPIIGRPNTGTFGRIEAGSLELSTVDIASEFVKLITLQRGFQANSRIITTINQLLNEIIQLA